MKKIVTLFALLFTYVAILNAQLFLDPTTATSASAAASPWTFNNGCTISNGNSKTYSTGTISTPSAFTGIKFSVGVQFTISLPSGYTVNSVQMTGYDNYAGKRTYISELNGVLNTDSLVNFFTAKDASSVATICSNTINLATPATNTLTFTLSGLQAVLKIILNPATASVENVTMNIDMNKIVDVYSIDGRRIKSNIMFSQAMQELANGVYVIEKQKIIINNK